MRYVAAMLVAVPMAALATMFVSGRVATAIVAQFTFDNPDSVADLHALVFMAVNVLALAIGWGIGWALGGRLGKEEPLR